ncbi:hypothetical protein VF21_07605 [Pseudogymnoascus sp. 05NY08]|nr:hypothetical protein VF21_07605 [Pseudogymnoascus sp. 05NY08]
MSELPGYSPYGVPPPEPASSTTSLATSLAASSVAPLTPSIRSATPPVFPDYPPTLPDAQPRESLAGPVKTTSLSDMQHDYFRVTRVTNTTYSIALTTDPTPLYRVEVASSIAADPAIQVFDLFNPLPLATARLHPAVATSQSCTRDPAGDNPKWRPLSLQHFSSIPLVVIPGMAPIERSVRWQHTTKYSTNLELWMRDPLFGISAGGGTQTTMPREMLLARYGIEGVGFIADRVLEIRRGGGMEFELVVLVQAFAILEADRRKKARKGGK